MAFDTEMNQVAPETAAAGIGGMSDVSAADLYTPEANGASDQTQQQQADAPNTQTDDRRYTSDDMSRAVSSRLKQERKKAAYVLGEELLRERMNADNITEAEALARIREDRIKQKAAAFKNNPEEGFAELMRQQRMSPGEEAQTPEARVESLYNAMTADIEAGKVPQGFDLNAHMSDRERAKEFVELYEALGMERACAIAMRMSPQKPTKAEMNRSLPQSERTNNSYNPQPVDFSAMDSKQFAEYKEKIRKANAQGKRVIF